MSPQLSDEEELQLLEQKIKQVQTDGVSINRFVLREIEILQNTLDTFLKQMDAAGRKNDIQIAEIEIRQYAAMRQLAQKIGAPTEKYDDLIRQVKIRIFGEENYENFFGETE